MKILFLDIDGVIVTGNSMENSVERYPNQDTQYLRGVACIDPNLVKTLNRLWDHHPDVKVVLSSNWRYAFRFEEIKRMFEEVKLKGEMIDFTVMKMSRLSRNLEILWWLEEQKEFPNINFAIIDDNNFFSEDKILLDRFVQTEGFEVGISNQDVDELIKLFNEGERK